MPAPQKHPVRGVVGSVAMDIVMENTDEGAESPGLGLCVSESDEDRAYGRM